MKRFKKKEKTLYKRVRGLMLVTILAICSMVTPLSKSQQVQAATGITSMSYFSATDGPVISKSGVGQASYGFVMPIFNGGAATWADVASDLTVNVKVNGSWVNIDNTDFAYNVNWGNWSDGGFNGYWFVVSKTTYLQLASKSTGVTLDYTLVFTDLPKTTITSMTATQGPNITAGVTGGTGFTYPIFNGDAAITYAAVADDLKVYVKPIIASEWIDIDNNAASGWIYDKNFGQFTDGGGGYWFTVTESINVKLESKTSHASLIYTITYNEPVRNNYLIIPYDGTTYTANESGGIGIPLPKIDGGAPISSELDKFVYEIKVNGSWVELSDYSKSSFSYSGNGYNNLSDKNQWGYWVDYIYGLWFQPIQVDMELRIGYPLNGQKGGSIGGNYVYYIFIGNPEAPRPDVSDMGNIPLSTPENPDIVGMKMIWGDEFNGTLLDTSVWNYNTGYYLNDDPGTWGWGNNELEHYTDSGRNVSVSNGKLTITALEDPKTFPQDPSRVAPYSSGKITTKDNFTFKYGRIDFRAKLPKGDGMWPALWLLPNDDTYGTWAASGELDVMEARGRLTGAVSGAIHFGGQWPANTYIGGDYSLPGGQTIDSDYHVYSVVWEEDNIKWYVDGVCFFKATNDQWYSNSAPSNNNAPFDQEFYIIMNLAVGGWFDGGIAPKPGDLPASMQVDYVRVYKNADWPEPNVVPVTGVTLDKQTASLSAIGETVQLNHTVTPSNANNKQVIWSSADSSIATVDQTGKVTAVGIGATTITVKTADGNKTASCQVMVKTTSTVYVVGDEVKGLKRIHDKLEFYVNGATFADLHYKINNGGLINVAMKNSGSGNFTYPVDPVKQGDVVEYFFTYNPGNGALDTQTFTYIHGVTQGTPEGGNTNPPVTNTNVALGKFVTASGTEGAEFSESNLTDNSTTTRWSSNFSDDAWFIIDLGATYGINQLVLNWEAAYGKQYDILVSMDGTNYTRVYKQTNGSGGIETIDIAERNAKYIKFQGIERALPYGYSLWDVKVMGHKN
ncbi:family 16 glycosylhydrolase [Anaerocolumna sp.]|uniref:family 16 glycosylhydrolase n=1 Tax=Anaerocolumna sp. TaxID=2041569 RepID=UPI0028A63BB5|nr:family 16 glycosylhydrolase [Anaerocolumna sp.]